MNKIEMGNYDILFFDKIKELDQYFDKFNNHNKVFVITDSTVYDLYNKDFKKLTKREIIWLVVPAGDSNKNMDSYLKLLTQLIDKKLSKTDLIVAFGGGIITDLTGFVAATIYRGVPFISIPTTLIAQIDSSVGGKNGINYFKYKNQVGSFYDPVLVLISHHWLETLPQRQILNAMGEIVKTALIGDLKLYTYLEENPNLLINQKLIRRAIMIKRKFVLKDYYDQNIRHVLNFGHTYGHAIESESNFEISHGEAVAHGLLKSLEIGERLKITEPGLKNRVEKYLYEAKIIDKTIPYDKYKTFLKQDKKSDQGGINLVLLEKIATPVILKISWENLDEIASWTTPNKR